ncbi:MAG: hypothetical protein ACLVL7_12190 [Anaerotruncus massiliensis (ex Togo et al. 2019)]
MNPASLTELHHCKLEASLAGAQRGDRQFVRMGYFCKDSKNPGTFNHRHAQGQLQGRSDAKYENAADVQDIRHNYAVACFLW